MYDHLRNGNYDAWRNYSGVAVEDSGQQEILNWMCLAGALAELKRKPAETRARDLLDLLGLGDKAKDSPGRSSPEA